MHFDSPNAKLPRCIPAREKHRVYTVIQPKASSITHLYSAFANNPALRYTKYLNRKLAKQVFGCKSFQRARSHSVAGLTKPPLGQGENRIVGTNQRLRWTGRLDYCYSRSTFCTYASRWWNSEQSRAIEIYTEIEGGGGG